MPYQQQGANSSANLYRVIKYSSTDTSRTCEDIEMTTTEEIDALLEGAKAPESTYNRVEIIPLFDSARTVNNTSSGLDVFNTSGN